MSTIVIDTRHLVGLATDLVRTAHKDPLHPHLCAVLLHTDNAMALVDDGEGGEEMMESEVLVVTSTTGRIIGQGHAPCNGQLHRPVLVSATDAGSIVKVFTALMKLVDQKTVTHRTQLELLGNTLTVSEDEEVVESGVELSIQVLDEEVVDNFPRNLQWALAPDPDAEVVDKDQLVIPPSYGTGLRGDDLAVVSAVSKRRGMEPIVYRSHQGRPVVVTVGSMYRVTVKPWALDPETGEHVTPKVAVFQPNLPTREKKDQPALIDA
jgi:hypothetical protein